MIKVWAHGFLNDDEHGYPDDRSGFYSTTDICNIFGFPMETLQQWMKDGFICPAYRVEYGRGMKSVFVRSQVLWIGVFKVLVERGIQRNLAVNWANGFLNILKESKKGTFDFYDLLLVEVDHKGVLQMKAFAGDVHIRATKDGNDIIIINLNRIIEKIKSFA